MNLPQFTFEKNWVRSTPQTLQQEFKKSNRGAPVIFKEMLIQANAFDGIGAYSLSSGQQIWKKEISNGVEVGPILGKNLYFGGSDGFFYALDPQTGQEIWKFKVGAEILSEPTVDQDKIYFLSGLNVLYALDILTGETSWVYSRPSSSEFSIRGGSKPAVYENNIFVGFSDGYFVSLDKKKGQVSWEISLNKNKRFKDIDSEPVVHEGLLYISGFDDHLYCLDKKTGAIQWKIKSGAYSAPIFFDQLLIYPTSQGEVWALNKKNSQRLWTYKVPQGIASSLKVYKGYVLFGESQGSLTLLNPKTGQILTQFNPGRGIFGSPTLDPQRPNVYFISNEANLYSVSLKENKFRVFDFL